jgi:Ca-activated chloride channel family protein
VIAASGLGVALLGPAWLLLLAALPALVWWRRRLRPRAPLAAAPWVQGRLAADLHVAPLPRSWRQRGVWLPEALEVLGLALAIVALARPVERLPLPPERLGRDVLLCLDTSSSMAATDLAAERTRLDVSKARAVEFVRRRSDDRLGFVAFARYADLGCPPTLDRESVAELLARVELVAKDGPEDATGIGAAVACAAEVLARSQAASKVVVVLTDGEENVATAATPAEIAPLHAAQWCRSLGVRVHSIAVGSMSVGASGQRLPLDTTALRQLAAGTGGRFFAAADDAALAGVWDAIDGLEATAFAEPRTWLREWFAVALLAGLACAFAARWCTWGVRAGVPC